MEFINEEHIKREIETIQDSIEYQKTIAMEIENTRAYRTLESFRYWKMLKGLNKIKNIKIMINHIKHGNEEMIQCKDPINTVVDLQDKTKKQVELLNDKIVGLNVSFNEYANLMEAIKRIYFRKTKTEGSICVFAPFEGLNMPDGYYRRVKNIDQVFPSKMLRIYISQDSYIYGNFPKCKIVDDKYISVKYNPKSAEQSEWIGVLSKFTGFIYIHSVYQFLSIILTDKTVVKMYDFHGVVPEELSYMGRFEESFEMDRAENLLINNVDYIVIANNATRKHINKKYPRCKARFILMPMNNEDNDVNDDEPNFTKNKANGSLPIVIYSGGLQKWQLIGEMQDAIEQVKDKFDYHICVPEPKKFLELWGDRHMPQKWEIKTKTIEELKEEYNNAVFGFILRDDFVVNNVACPTKLIDYIKYNIIPIMKTTHIGDFDEKGINYLSLDDFVKGIIPTEKERKEMCRKNMRILENIMEEYRMGKLQISEIIRESIDIK